MNTSTQSILAELYRKATGIQADTITPLTQSGSNRHYFRISAKTSSDAPGLIGVEGTSQEENHAFLYMVRHFTDKGLNVPHVMAWSQDEKIGRAHV